jgi:transcription elongation factor GreA
MPTYLSAATLEEMKEELAKRETVTRKHITGQISDAIALGDLSENFEYHSAKDEQGLNEARIRELTEKIRDAVVIEETKGATEITLGTKFDVEVNGMSKTFYMVGSSEANPVEGKVSNESPIGVAFIGKKGGEVVEVQVPSGLLEYKIIKLH